MARCGRGRNWQVPGVAFPAMAVSPSARILVALLAGLACFAVGMASLAARDLRLPDAASLTLVFVGVVALIGAGAAASIRAAPAAG